MLFFAFRSAFRIIRNTVLLLVIANICNDARAQHSALIAIKSEQSGLPESIRRETFAAIDGSRRSILALRDADHLWTRDDGAQTVFPVLALCDPFPKATAEAVDAALETAAQRLSEKRSQPWTPFTASEAAYAALASRMNQARPLETPVLTRLSRVKLSTLSPTDAALLLIALEQNGICVEGGWQAVINTVRHERKPVSCHVAIAALGRLKSASSGTDKPGDDVLAHVRWLTNQLSLRSNLITADSPDALTPEAAYFITVLASSLPRQTLANDATLFPYNWRNAIANRLIAQQRFDLETGHQFWKASTPTGSDLQSTTYAIMTLVLLAE